MRARRRSNRPSLGRGSQQSRRPPCMAVPEEAGETLVIEASATVILHPQRATTTTMVPSKPPWRTPGASLAGREPSASGNKGFSRRAGVPRRRASARSGDSFPFLISSGALPPVSRAFGPAPNKRDRRAAAVVRHHVERRPSKAPATRARARAGGEQHDDRRGHWPLPRCRAFRPLSRGESGHRVSCISERRAGGRGAYGIPGPGTSRATRHNPISTGKAWKLTSS